MSGQRTDSPEALLRAARELQREGRTAEAITAYYRLLERVPDLPDSWYNLGVLLRSVHQYSAALAAYQNALTLGIRDPEEVHVNRAVIYSDFLHQSAAAERELQAALQINPRYVPALLNLGNLHEDLGRREQAAACYEQILKLQPQNVEALARSAGLHKFTSASDPLIQQLRHRLQDTTAGDAPRALAGFALGRALDECQDYPAAFAAYTFANRLSRASVPPDVGHYDRAAQAALVDRLIRVFDQPAPIATGYAPPDATSPRPLFICGMIRSGSTLIEQVLAGHPQITAGGELGWLPALIQAELTPYPESLAQTSASQLEQLASRYLGALRDSFPGAERVTDKRPDNFLHIGLIKRLFPHAKIVHTQRAPLDNCLSIFFLHLDQRLSYALDLLDIGHYYVQYQRLMRHWQQLYPGDIFDVSYDALVHDPAEQTARLFAFLGLEWDGQIRHAAVDRPVKSASVWQVREPLYQRSSGRAQHYARELEPLCSYLQSAGTLPGAAVTA